MKLYVKKDPISQSKEISSVQNLLYSYLLYQEEEEIKSERNKEISFVWKYIFLQKLLEKPCNFNIYNCY